MSFVHNGTEYAQIAKVQATANCKFASNLLTKFLNNIISGFSDYLDFLQIKHNMEFVKKQIKHFHTLLQNILFGFFSNRWCKRENVEPDALKEWKINIFKIIDTRISFYSRNTHLLPPKPKSSFRHLKRGIQDFHMNYVLVPADKAANNVVVV